MVEKAYFHICISMKAGNSCRLPHEMLPANASFGEQELQE